MLGLAQQIKLPKFGKRLPVQHLTLQFTRLILEGLVEGQTLKNINVRLRDRRALWRFLIDSVAEASEERHVLLRNR